MRGLFLTLGLILSGLSFAQGEGSPPPVPAATPTEPVPVIAQGETVTIEGAGFTITPPIGWEIVEGGAGASFLFQAPKVEAIPGGPVVYQSNLIIAAMNGPRPFDETTQKEFSDWIMTKGPNLATNYNIRSSDKVTLQGGDEGFLYFTEFTQGGQPMMQMIIMVSSASKHFLMTYTDLATVFETGSSPEYTAAFNAMHSAKLDSKPPERWTQHYIAAGLVLALLVLMIIIRVVRGYNMRKLGDRIDSDDGDSSSRDDDDDDDDVSGIAQFKGHSNNRSSDDDDDDFNTGMPETREAVRPAPKSAKRSAPAPVQPAAPRAPAPAPKPAPRAPAPPPASEFAEENLEKTTSAGKAAKNKVVSEHEEEEDYGSWKDEPRSDLSDIQPQPITTKKAKPQKVANPAKMKDLEDDGTEASDVARLSEILPNTGDTKKKKGLFGWGKGNDAAGDDEDDVKPSKKSSKNDDPPMSEVAGWNLKEPKKSRLDDDDDD